MASATNKFQAEGGKSHVDNHSSVFGMQLDSSLSFKPGYRNYSPWEFSCRIDPSNPTLDMGHSTPPVSVFSPTFEQHHDGFGVQCVHPRLSWRFACSNEQIRNWKQTAYDIAISCSTTEPGQVFHVESEDNVLVPWPSSEPLDSRARRFVRVRSYGKYSLLEGRDNNSDHESVTEWSASSLLEIALLRNSDWTGSMITVSEPWPLSPDHSARPLCFHKRFHLSLKTGTIDRGRLYATSHGVYSVRINGKIVGDHCLAPGFQSYHKRLHYQIYDTKDLLVTPGWNKIEIDVAAGWFASATSWARKRFIYGQKLGVLAQLEIWVVGSTSPILVSTDPSWIASITPLVSSEILDGEIFDQSLSMGSKPDDAKLSVRESPIPVSRLVSPEAPPVRVVERLKPKDIFTSRSGSVVIVDFGQNIAGRICVRKVQKPAGSQITFRHAEVIQDGEIMCRPLRTAKARDIIICDGRELLDWHPHYTFHGFRYVEIAGWGPDDQNCPLTKACIVAEVMHTDMMRTGWFSCSNDDVNRLHENAVCSIKSNFLSVPTECPSRDERFGWTGDLNIIAPTANFLYDTTGMLKNWLQDLYLDQMETEYWRQGVVPLFVPNSLLRNGDGGHGWDPMPNGVWGDAAVMVPWGLYRMSGDINFLSAQYASMVQYLEKGVTRGQDGLWDPEQWQFGDWLDPRAPLNDSGRGTTDGTFVADCFLIASTQIAAEVAAVLAKPADSSRLRDTALRLVHSWRDKYLTAAGLVVPDTATALSLALSFDLLPESRGNSTKAQAAARLFRLVRLNDFKLTTGFVGSALLSRALTRSGGVELAYTMLFQKKCPSYLYPITMGATTTWERWDSMLPDGSVNPGSMTSFNHHALGSIANWMHADVGGLEAIEPGWKVFRVKPQPNGELSWADTAFESRYGRIELRWTLKGDFFRMRLRVPPNSTAVISLPRDGRASEVGKQEAKEQIVGSGEYYLGCQFLQPQWPSKALLPPWGRAEF
ncbi:glycoside hydrolase family 78 protein [Trichoderma velutinum]